MELCSTYAAHLLHMCPVALLPHSHGTHSLTSLSVLLWPMKKNIYNYAVCKPLQWMITFLYIKGKFMGENWHGCPIIKLKSHFSCDNAESFSVQFVFKLCN